jgi:hypothetical protein
VTANPNSRSLGQQTPNKNLSASDVSVPSHTPSGPNLYRRFVVGPNPFIHTSHLSHHSHPAYLGCQSPPPAEGLVTRELGISCSLVLGHWSLRLWPAEPSATSNLHPISPNYSKFTFHNPLISRVCTGLHLNKKYFASAVSHRNNIPFQIRAKRLISMPNEKCSMLNAQ